MDAMIRLRQLNERLAASLRKKRSPPRNRRILLEALEARLPLAGDLDVWIDSVEVPAEVRPGENFQLRWTVASHRSGTVPDVYYLVYLSRDEILGEGDPELRGDDSTSR